MELDAPPAEGSAPQREIVRKPEVTTSTLGKRRRKDSHGEGGVGFVPDEEQLRRYKRHQFLDSSKEKKRKHQRHLDRQLQLNDEAVKRLAASELLLTETPGYLEPEGFEKTHNIHQTAIVQAVDIGSAAKAINLELPFGPYRVDFTQNGRYLLMGGQQGQLSVVDCHSLGAVSEINVKETVRAVRFLHNQDMWAVAQKKYTYIYDNQGIELHCLRDHRLVYQMEYLPYHYLLVSTGEFGDIRYQDVSTGKIAAFYKTKRGPCKVMTQNPSNAVIMLGNQSGSVSLWTPNVGKPVVEFLAHHGRVTAATCIGANHLATAGYDGMWKIWDIRRFEVLHTFTYNGSPPTAMAASQTGLLGFCNGPRVEIWKGVTTTAKPNAPYMQHCIPGAIVEDLAFRPFEDVCYLGTNLGVEAMLVPGSALPTFDSHGADPYETLKQKREHEIHRLLEKLPATSITLDPSRLGLLDPAPRLVLEAERDAEIREAAEARALRKKRKKKDGDRVSKGPPRPRQMTPALRLQEKEAVEKARKEKEEAEPERFGWLKKNRNR